MDIVISHASAIRLIREARETPGATIEKTDLMSVPKKPRQARLTVRQLNALGFESLCPAPGDRTIDLFAPDAAHRYRLRGTRTHVLSGDVPVGSIMRIRRTSDAPSVLVAGPALCVALAASLFLEDIRNRKMERWRAVVRLVELCAELCGTYSRNPFHPRSGQCTFGLEPFTTADDIHSGLLKLRGIDGLALAREAANYAFDGSASPMETLHWMMLCLPSSLGGLALSKPFMNEPIKVDEIRRPFINYVGIRPDLSWILLKIAIEHDGEEWHDLGGRRVLDAKRIQDYQTLGWVVLPATFDDVRRQSSYNAFAMRLCRLMEERGERGVLKRVKGQLKDESFTLRQAILLSMLLPPVGRYSDGAELLAA